jgi:hypothetical protein
MACGDIAWWRAPDPAALLERHGTVEHLLVQVDLVFQLHRDPRAEFSIPGASKTSSGSTGFADIVSIATNEIWEIKPEHLEETAAKEAQRYARFAKGVCGPGWRPGTSYTTTTYFGGGGVVFRIQGAGNKAELIAEQRKPGAVVYYWKINGKKVGALTGNFVWAVRQQVVTDYLGPQPQPLTGAKPPNNLPPPKFKPPVLVPDGCIPQLGKLIKALNNSIRTTCAQTVLENSAVQVLIDVAYFNAIAGPGIVARQVASMQVKTDPTVTLFRKALEAIMVLWAAETLTVVVLLTVRGGIPMLVRGVELIPGAIAVILESSAAGGAPVATSEGLVGSFLAGLRGALSGRPMVATGAAVLALAIPKASNADPGTPVSFDVGVPKFVVVPPGKQAGRVGQTVTTDGREWVIAGIARTPPD